MTSCSFFLFDSAFPLSVLPLTMFLFVPVCVFDSGALSPNTLGISSVAVECVARLVFLAIISMLMTYDYVNINVVCLQ